MKSVPLTSGAMKGIAARIGKRQEALRPLMVRGKQDEEKMRWIEQGEGKGDVICEGAILSWGGKRGKPVRK